MRAVKKCPYLATWIGFVVLTQAANLVYGFGVLRLNLSMDGAPRLLEIILYGIGGFYLFRALVRRYILTSLQRGDGALQAVENDRPPKYPFLAAWIGFVVLSVMIYAMLGWFFFSLIPVSNFTATILAYSALYAFIGFFVFRKAIQSYIVRDHYTETA